jgi:signal transduction histidine kinase
MEYVRVTRLNEELQEVDLNRVVTRVIKNLKPPEEMEISIESPLPVIRFEPRRAEQIFHSLLENAVRYMDKRLGIIRIACVGEAADAAGVGAAEEQLLPGGGGWWNFRVSDNGPGIEEGHFEKIFAVFQTLQARDNQESSGMGLALVRKIVGKFAGRVWVESQVGQGSTFHFTLPKEP